jgi:transcriptional antiterminator RfaH
LGLEIFLPRIRYKRATRRGPAWTTEALFLNYLFARFDLARCVRRVHHARGVHAVVHFGRQWPTVPPDVIQELRAQVGEEDVILIPDMFGDGDPVQIVVGPFLGLTAVVRQAMPAAKRLAVLLEFLGQQTTVELSVADVVLDTEELGRSELVRRKQVSRDKLSPPSWLESESGCLTENS